MLKLGFVFGSWIAVPISEVAGLSVDFSVGFAVCATIGAAILYVLED